VRTFSRRFREEVGMTPVQWLTQQRIDHARRLLETTDLPVDRVAEESGFGTAASLRQHMAATVGVSPMTYRQTFRAQAARARTDQAQADQARSDPVRAQAARARTDRDRAHRPAVPDTA
jgi:hypothetical protein